MTKVDWISLIFGLVVIILVVIANKNNKIDDDDDDWDNFDRCNIT